MIPDRFAPVLAELSPLAARFEAAGHRLYLVGGTVRDLVAWLSGDIGAGYVAVFFIEAGLLLVSLALLSQIDVNRFRSKQPNLLELAALTADA